MYIGDHFECETTRGAGAGAGAGSLESGRKNWERGNGLI